MGFLTVAICTLDRPDSLARALASLERQTGSFDVIVIDNSPARSARDSFDAFHSRFRSGDSKYVGVPQLGLSAARNAALSEAATRFVAFIDDDVSVPQGWVEAVHAGLGERGVVIAGGAVRLAWEKKKPRWMLREHEGFYSGLDLGEAEREFDLPFETPYGANLVVDRQLALERGGFDTRLGRKGAGLVGGEDVDLAIRLAESGSVRYLPSAWVWHHVEPQRATRRWLLRRYFAQGRTWSLTTTVQRPPADDPSILRRSIYKLRPRPLGRYVKSARLLPYRIAARLGALTSRSSDAWTESAQGS